MASVKAYFAVGLLMTAFCTSSFGLEHDIPDDVVYTDITKTLIRNNTGVLTCRFKGTPLAVYWKRGWDPRNAPLLVRLHYGEKSGPRYGDGSCDIDEKYSLVIKRVRNEDAGRYICRVSNYKGNLIHNFTDVTLTGAALKTGSAVALRKGRPGVLPCEPIIRPKKISWLRSPNERLVTLELSGNVLERSGPGYDEGLFNITKEYSLVIKDVMIMHEDRYICEVTDDDTDKLFWNATELSVFALPMEPFPSIEECPKEQQNLSACTLRIRSHTMVTCQVEGYYPYIDLYFVHGSERVDALETRVWNNSDGTKSKSIIISSRSTSDSIFECVAAGLVGRAHSRSMAIHLIQDAQQSVAVAVVVPVVLFSAIVAVSLLVFSRRKTLLKRKYKRVPMVDKQKQKDLISYIEIWMMVKYAFQQRVNKNLAKVLDHLLGDGADSYTLQTDKDYYNEMCKWKRGYNGACQRRDLFDACRNQGLEAASEQLRRYLEATREVTSHDLEHTLWHVGESDKISELLKELGALPEQINRLHNKDKNDVIVGAMNVLKYWKDVNRTGNQEVMLSLALEKINYSPHDEDFFLIPEWQKRGLGKQEIHDFLLPKITSRHCRELVDAMMKLKEEYPVSMKLFGPIKSKDVWLDDVVEKNRTDLFDSHQLIEDWWAEQNCSNYEKRRKLRSAEKVLQDQGTKILTEPRKDHEDSFDKKSESNHGLLSRPKGEFIYKAELVDMALDLIMEDFRPIAQALGIKGTRLASYKRPFHHSHLQLGTISLLTALQPAKVTDSSPFRNVMRKAVCNILNEAGYQRATSRFMFASEPSYGELFALEDALTRGETPGEIKSAKKSKSHTKVTKESQSYRKTEILHGNRQEPPRTDATLTAADGEETLTSYERSPEGSCGKRVDDLQRILGLADEDIPEGSINSVLMMFKIWKERISPGLTDHRAVLVEGVKKIGKPNLVPAITNGEYHSNKTSVEFIENMLKGLDEDRRASLESLLKKEDKKKWPKSSSGKPEAICGWVADWTKEMEGFTLNSKNHRNFNDKLVEHGFLDLAREIMNIEQYW